MKMKKNFNDYIFAVYLLFAGGVLLSQANSFLEKISTYRTEQELEKDLEDFVSNIQVDIDVQDISQEAKDAISTIYSYSTDNPYLEALEITPELASMAYTSDWVEDDNHTNTQYYDAFNDTILWDDLAEQIYDNTVLNEKKNPSLLLPSKSYILRIIDHFKQFYQQVKKDFPDYDTKRLACILENFFLQFENELHSTATAITTTDFEKTWISYYSDYYSSFKKQKILIAMNFFMLLQESAYCDDTYSAEAFKYGSVDISTPMYYNGEYDPLHSSRFNYDFLEEIYATLYSCEFTGSVQNSYIYYDEVLDLLQATLGLSDDYEIDCILGDLLICDGKQFIQRFPIYNEDAVEGFIENLEMLKGIDILLGEDKAYQDYLNENEDLPSYDFPLGYSVSDTVEKRLVKLYFSNLIMLNEQHPEGMTLEDNLVFLHILDKELKNSGYSLYVAFYGSTIESFGREAFDEFVDNYDFDSHLQSSSGTILDYQNEMLNYLSQRYQVDLNSLEYRLLELNYTLPENYTFPEFMGEEKKQFYNYLLTNDRNLEDTYDRVLVKSKEK